MKKNIVITGANRGIGLALTKIFQQQGDTVYAVCRKTSPALTALSVNVIEHVDVATDEGINNLATALSSVEIDVLVCSAGILRDESLSDLNIETIREQFEVNAIAPLRIVEVLQKNISSG
jgi:NAD(P)-dependent dehydrogenase (short-subunit alcohol dehydrogenase family)